MTKPEGPAQEPRCDEDGRCTVCGLEWEHQFEHEFHECPPGFGQKPVPVVPATPTPSQPAGARWLKAHRDEMFALACAFDEARLAELMDAFLADETAALTDKLCRMQDDIATIVSTHRADWSWNDVVADVKGLAAQSAAKDEEIERLNEVIGILHADKTEEENDRVAAERERDSLRVENAALKAGKDGQQ
jgi:hypothetical protein